MTIQNVITAFSFFYSNNVNFIEFILKKNHFLKNIIHTRSDKTYDLVSGYK